MSKDYVFHINWADRHKQPYRVGILAQIDNVFYLILKNEETAKTAYSNGYDGLPGFDSDEVYISEKKLFDFFQRRVLENNPEKQCEELAQTRGISMVDSFSVEQISEKLSERYKKIVLEAYALQVQKNKMHEQENEKQPKNDIETNSEDWHDIE